MPVPISNGFTLDATPILIFCALIVTGYVVLNVKRMLNKENAVNETTSTQDEAVTAAKEDNVEADTNQNSSEDDFEEGLYENYEDNKEVFTLNRR